MRKVEIDIDDFITRMWEESINEISGVLSSLDNSDPSSDNEKLKEVCNIVIGKACAIDELKAIYSIQQRGKGDCCLARI